MTWMTVERKLILSKPILSFFLIDDDPDNTVSIMLDGVESRLHIINIDIDYV